MKYAIVAGCILIVADAAGIILKDNGTECLIDCDLEPDKVFSFDNNCEKYVQCLSSGWMISPCWGGQRFDEEAKTCVLKNETETPVCHPCAGYPPYVWTASDCPVDCKANLGKNVSHSFDCKVYIECTAEDFMTSRDCPDDQKFSDAVGACIEPPEGSGPTCHPCRSWEMSSEKPLVENSGVHERVDLTKNIILIFIPIILVLQLNSS